MNPAFEATVTFAPDAVAGPQGGARPAPFAEWLRRLLGGGRRVAADALDRSTGLYNRAGLFAAANEAMQLRTPDAPASVIVLDFADLREVCDIYGHAIARKVIAKLVRRLRSTAGARGLVGRTGPAQFTFVLPATPREQAIRRLQRGLGKPARIEFDAGDSEIVLVPDLLVDTTEPGATRVQDVYREMCRDLTRIQKEERRRLNWLASERERHSRPMSLPPRAA